MRGSVVRWTHHTHGCNVNFPCPVQRTVLCIILYLFADPVHLGRLSVRLGFWGIQPLLVLWIQVLSSTAAKSTTFFSALTWMTLWSLLQLGVMIGADLFLLCTTIAVLHWLCNVRRPHLLSCTAVLRVTEAMSWQVRQFARLHSLAFWRRHHHDLPVSALLGLILGTQPDAVDLLDLLYHCSAGIILCRTAIACLALPAQLLQWLDRLHLSAAIDATSSKPAVCAETPSFTNVPQRSRGGRRNTSSVRRARTRRAVFRNHRRRNRPKGVNFDRRHAATPVKAVESGAPCALHCCKSTTV